jgi:hypothetical protein
MYLSPRFGIHCSPFHNIAQQLPFFGAAIRYRSRNSIKTGKARKHKQEPTVEPAARAETLDIDSANRMRPSTSRGNIGQTPSFSSRFYLNGGERLERIADVKKL